MTVSRAGTAAMSDMASGEGERREAARQRRRWTILAALFAAGLVTGFYMGFKDAGAMFGGEGAGAWSPAMALALTALYLIALAGGTLLLKDVMDEHERQRSYKAASFASTLLVCLYPPWFLLWKGGFVAEPVHWLIYLVFMAGLGLAMLFYRFR